MTPVLNFVLLQGETAVTSGVAAETTEQAPVQAVTVQPDPTNPEVDQTQPEPGFFARNSMWIMLLLIFGVMWLFMIRPQRKQQKELENFRKSLGKGDKVVTVGGIYGEIVEVNEKTALIKVDGEVKLRVDKAGLVKDFSAQQQ